MTVRERTRATSAMVSLAGAGGGIGEAPSNTQLHGHARTPSSPSNALDKFMRALLPQSSFPSSLSHHHNSGEGDGNVAGAIAKGGEEAALYGQGQDLARTTSSSSSLLRQPSDIPPDAAVYSVSTASSSPTSKSRIKVPRASIGEGKAAHAHRHNLSIDDSSKPTKAPMATITRTRSKTGVANASVARAASPASFYAGGIGVWRFCTKKLTF